ncbi:MAG: hypothetical protein KBF99_16630, partial [Leptospiraceae bacterium]|nr:hypothetical protein [Leptospiraceae bacterium]
MEKDYHGLALSPSNVWTPMSTDVIFDILKNMITVTSNHLLRWIKSLKINGERSILQKNDKANLFVLRKIDFSRSLIYSCSNYMKLAKAQFEMTVIFFFLFLLTSQCSLLTYRTSEVKQNEFQYTNISKAHFTPNNEKPFPLTVRRGNNIYNSTTRDGKYLFFASDSSGNFDLYLRDLQSSAVLPVTSHPAPQYKPAIS